MLEEFAFPAYILELDKANLSDDSTQFTRGCRDAVSSRPVASGEGSAWHNKGGCIRPKVLKEVDEAVEKDESFGDSRIFGECIKSEACYALDCSANKGKYSSYP